MKLEEATVLVVDDEQDLREVFAGWLGRSGCRVLTAANGAEALALLETETVHVLLSDIRMPVMGGVELVRRVYEKKLAIPTIIFVSGFEDAVPREMYGHGVEALMEKPMDRRDLLKALERSLGEHEQMWFDPWVEPMAQSVSIEMESLEQAVRTGQFQLGRGGCCFDCKVHLKEKQTLDLTVQFVGDGRDLKTQAMVRWFDMAEHRAGVSFHYLNPKCRDWVIAAIKNGQPLSFIPNCNDPKPVT